MRKLGALAMVVVLGCGGTKKVTGVPPSLAVSPSSLDFKTVRLGQTAQLPVMLTAQTAATVDIASSILSGDSAFSIANAPSSIDPNGSATLTVTFAPTSTQRYSGMLTLTSNDETQPSQTVTLTGRGGTESVAVSLENPEGSTATFADDGGLLVVFGEPAGGQGGSAWPEVLVQNIGLVDAQLTSASVTGAGFAFVSAPNLPQTIAPEQTRALQLEFTAPTDGGTDFSGEVDLGFDDPLHPTATVQLRAHVTPNAPPVACAFIASAQELDGTVNQAVGGPVPVEPGAQLGLTAFSEDVNDVADGGPTPCSEDPEDGRAISFLWTVQSAPAGSHAAFASATVPRPTFVPDRPGAYVVALRVTDSKGASAGATVPFTAAPLEDLSVQLAWPEGAGVDLDLHFVRPGATLFQPGDVSSLTADAGRDWGTPSDPTDDPRFSGDDQGDGALAESATLNHPERSCLGDGGCTFGVFVHEFQDRRALLDGGSCGQTACFEGSACGCAGANAVCEPGGNGAVCATEVAPQVEIYLKGQVTPAITVPLGGASLDAYALAGPCFTWHALDVDVQPDGGPVLRVPGDGGATEYWGDHTDSTRECRPGAGGYAPQSPPLLTP